MCFNIFFLLFFINVINARSVSDRGTDDPALLVISYDAFRTEYFNRNVTPFMNRLRQEGSSVEYMRNVFPTKTFVNHYSIATGLYPGVHGVLANSLYDLKLKKQLSYDYEMFHYNENILPIWTLNEQAGGHSGCMMWPGSNLPYNNRTCTFTQPYNSTALWKYRVDTAIEWLKDPKTPANLVMMYIEEPDKHGHAYSPDSEIVTNIVHRLDNLTKYIQEKLISENLIHRVNVIHVSDHGMESVTSPNFIDLTKWLKNGTYEMYGSSPILQIVPVDGKENDVFTNLQNAAKINGHFNVYNKDNLPERWHSENEQRMGPITAVADLNYAFQDMFEAAVYYNNVYNVSISPTQEYGIHGYDNNEPSMHSFFFAYGPVFKKRNLISPFDSVDLFNLFGLILNIKLMDNNGTVQNIVNLLENPIGSNAERCRSWPTLMIAGFVLLQQLHNSLDWASVFSRS